MGDSKSNGFVEAAVKSLESIVRSILYGLERRLGVRVSAGTVGITLGSFWDHFGIILGSLWHHFGIILGSLWDHFGIILGSRRGDFGITLVFGEPLLGFGGTQKTFGEPWSGEEYAFLLKTVRTPSGKPG